MTKITSSNFLAISLASFCIGILVTCSIVFAKNDYIEDENKININITSPVKIEEETVREKEIVADLDNMKIYLKENGNLKETYDIVSIGKPDSFYETPAGDYMIELKERSHFSRIGKVYMPYSMQFFGNFFIHGIPYHEDGTKVSTEYSGGCIRISDENIESIYNFADRKTHVTVIRQDKIWLDNIDQNLRTKEMSINIMTALISLETIDQNRDLANYGNIKSALSDMFKYNDIQIAKSIASIYGEGNFINKMNEKAAAIGLTNTRYNSLNYKDEKNIIDNEDTVKLINYIINNKSYIYKIILKVNNF